MRVDGRITHSLIRVSTSPATEVPSSRDELNGRQGLKWSAIHPMPNMGFQAQLTVTVLRQLNGSVEQDRKFDMVPLDVWRCLKSCRGPRSLALKEST